MNHQEQKRPENSDESEQFRKVFIGGLNYRTTESTLREYFSKYGDIVDCVVMQDTNGRSRGFGFVTYAKSDMVDELMKNRPHVLDRREADVKRAMPKESSTPEIRLAVKKIFIGAIRDGVSDSDLRDYFGTYGEITDCVVMKDASGALRGFGFVEFSDCDSVDRIILDKNHVINGQTLDVKKAIPKGSAPPGISSSRGRPPMGHHSRLDDREMMGSRMNRGDSRSMGYSSYRPSSDPYGGGFGGSRRMADNYNSGPMRQTGRRSGVGYGGGGNYGQSDDGYRSRYGSGSGYRSSRFSPSPPPSSAPYRSSSGYQGGNNSSHSGYGNKGSYMSERMDDPYMPNDQHPPMDQPGRYGGDGYQPRTSGGPRYSRSSDDHGGYHSNMRSSPNGYSGGNDQYNRRRADDIPAYDRRAPDIPDRGGMPSRPRPADYGAQQQGRNSGGSGMPPSSYDADQYESRYPKQSSGMSGRYVSPPPSGGSMGSANRYSGYMNDNVPASSSMGHGKPQGPGGPISGGRGVMDNQMSGPPSYY